MAIPHRTRGRLWAGRIAAGAVLVGLAVYLSSVGLDKADKISSCLSLLVAVGFALAPHLLPAAEEGRSPAPDRVGGTGKATAEAGGVAVTGAQVTGTSGPVVVANTGDAQASGPGSNAVSGVQRLPRAGH
jgi:hypothetical protein